MCAPTTGVVCSLCLVCISYSRRCVCLPYHIHLSEWVNCFACTVYAYVHVCMSVCVCAYVCVYACICPLYVPTLHINLCKSVTQTCLSHLHISHTCTILFVCLCQLDLRLFRQTHRSALRERSRHCHAWRKVSLLH